MLCGTTLENSLVPFNFMIKDQQQEKRYFGYIRVSSTKQGDSASLPAQKRIIKEYAKKHNLKIVKFFKEIKSAGKEGRTQFNRMIKELTIKKANGIIFHKLDRSTRNMKEWAMIEELFKKKVDIHFISGEFNFETPTGKLSARMQAAMSAFYLDNLSEEVKKGLYQRLEDGIYPFGAPPGYRNRGPGKLKKIDQIQGELVKKCFELYATGDWSEKKLAKHMKELGLKSMRGNLINKNNISSILNNKFYIGIIEIKGKTFYGKHKPLISTDLFNKCQRILDGRYFRKKAKHYYIFRSLLRCSCGRKLRCIFAKNKYFYYYCNSCKTRCIEEGKIEDMFLDYLDKLAFTDKEAEEFKQEIRLIRKNTFLDNKNQTKVINFQIGQLKQRLKRLLDLRLDSEIEGQEYELKKSDIVFEIKKLEEKRAAYDKTDKKVFERLEELGKLLKSPSLSYKKASSENRRRLVQIFSENLILENQDSQKLILEWKTPFDIVAERQRVLLGGDDGI